jgi:hypothetical protein
MPLTDNIKAVMSLYYAHRKAANIKHIHWHKDKDLDLIFDAAQADGFSTVASCGTFWFTSTTENIRANEKNYMEGGESSPRDKPFGFFAEINGALNKAGKEAMFINADEYGGVEEAIKLAVKEKVKDKMGD